MSNFGSCIASKLQRALTGTVVVFPADGKSNSCAEWDAERGAQNHGHPIGPQHRVGDDPDEGTDHETHCGTGGEFLVHCIRTMH